MAANPFDALEGHRYIRLMTFRKSGAAVPTPVWFARVGDGLYVVTGRHTGKVKRIRNNPNVVLAPSGFGGRPKGPDIRATAHLTDQRKGDPADRALKEKYGWQYDLFLRIEGMRGAAEDLVYLQLLPPEGGG